MRYENGSQPRLLRPVIRRPFPPAPLRRAFTLLEMMVVIAIIAILIGFLVPAMSTFTKSSGRKAAIGNLLGVFEQARAQAIKDQLPTYVVFPAFSSGPQATLDRYNYKSFAIFEDDPANSGTVKQLTNWKTLPTGISIRSQGANKLSLLPPASTPTPPTLTITFTPDAGSTVASYYYVKYNTSGEIELPQANVNLTVFEGLVSNGNEIITSAKDSSGGPAASESLTIARLTGRAVTN